MTGCEEMASAYDTSERTWRHLNFFQYKTFIHTHQPRIKCKEHGVKTVEVPWAARPGSGFTLLFESWCLELAKHVPVSVIAEMVDENDTRLWRFIDHYVTEARKAEDYSTVKTFEDDFALHGGNAGRVGIVTCDMSLGFAGKTCKKSF